MNDVDIILAKIQAIIIERSKRKTTNSEQHALVLYFYSLFKRSGEEHHLFQLQQKLKELIAEMLGKENQVHSVLSFPVIASLYKDNLINGQLHEYIELLDVYLVNKTKALIRENTLSFLFGASGIINYFAVRLPDPAIKAVLNTLFSQFFELIKNQVMLLGNNREVDLRLPDGLSGLLLVLIKCYEKGVGEEEIKKFIQEEVLQIISYRMDLDFSDNRYSLFPNIIERDGQNYDFDNSLNWSKGDLNKAILFHKAGQLLNDTDLNHLSNLVGLNTLLRKDKNTTNIINSCFSTGSSGLAEAYKFLYNATEIPAYKDGYDFWIRRTILLLSEELDTGFYTGKELNVMDGIIGAALPLLSYQSDHEIKWGSCLLL